MESKMNRRPAPADYHEYYHGYVERVPDGDIATTLAEQFADSRRLLEAVTPGQETHRYAPGKWSVREVVTHLVDTEAMFTGRILWIARQPEIELPGMDQDHWVGTSGGADRPMAELIEDFATVRAATVRLLRSLPAEAWENRGVASGHPVALRAIPWMIAGHERAHRAALKRDYGIDG